MKNLGACEAEGNFVFYNNTAVLFFADNLNSYFKHTTITCALFKGIDKASVLDRKDFNDDIVSSIDKTILFLQQHLKTRYEFNGSPARIEISEIPSEALREAVINAIVHRDYFQKGANIHIGIYDNRVEIVSPGSLPKGLKIEDFGKHSLLRNPNLANLMHRIGYIEKMGTGIQRIRKLMLDAGLPPVEYTFTDFVSVCFYREMKVDIPDNVGDNVGDKRRNKILNLIKTNNKITARQLADKLSVSDRTIERDIEKLKENKQLTRIGTEKSGYWKIL